MLFPSLFIAKTLDKGRGVFTETDIDADVIIEVSPVIVMSNLEKEHLDNTLLHDYIFLWGETLNQCCMALGFVPMYNHSYESNCEYFMDFEDETIMLKTIRKINAGEELTINYNGDWNNSEKVWFDKRN